MTDINLGDLLKGLVGLADGILIFCCFVCVAARSSKRKKSSATPSGREHRFSGIPGQKPPAYSPPSPKSPPDLRLVGGSGGNKIKRT